MRRTSKVKVVVLTSATLAGLMLFRWLAPGVAQQGKGVGGGVMMEPSAVGLRFVLGPKDELATEWQGEVSLSSGSVAGMTFWETSPESTISGSRFQTRSWKVRRIFYAFQELLYFSAQFRPAGSEVPQGTETILLPPQLHVTLTAPANVQVELTTNHGAARFSLSDTQHGKPVNLLDGKAYVEQAPAVFRLTGEGRDEDFPSSATAPDGSVWVVYSAYQSGEPLDEEAIQDRRFDSMVPKNNGDSILLIQYDGKRWSAPLEVTEGLRDVWRPTVACDGKGGVWVTWSEQRQGNWDLYQRQWNPTNRQWSGIKRLTDAPGADINAVSTTDSKGTVWWAWQGWRGDNFSIFLNTSSDDNAEPTAVADTTANEWNPAIAADSAGNVYVGWDSYAAGNYDAFVRRLGAAPEEAIPVADTDYFEARISLACDSSDRLWIAYEEGDPNWGKDYANTLPNRSSENLGAPLYRNRRLKVKTLAGDRLLVPAEGLGNAYGDLLNLPKSFPRLMTDAGGNVWLFFRHHSRPTQGDELWAGSATHFNGKEWSAAQLLPASDNLLDNRPALAPWKDQGVLAVYSSDQRSRGAKRGGNENDLFATILSAPRAAKPMLVADDSTLPSTQVVHPREDEDIARMRSYRMQADGKTYRLLRGEFHRHTEYSSHGDQDGGLEDMWRYALDAADMDWLGNGDHDSGNGREYSWWIIQKGTDIVHNPPYFVPPFTHERSLRYPNGHRNVMFSRRGIRPLPRGPLPGTAEGGTPDTKLLYAYLHHFGGICAVHTSGTTWGTDWRDNDPEVEPVVEIYQGHRNSYEHHGAPRAATVETQIGGYYPAGFIWNALAKGYRLGFESSSDHVSTHISYAVVLTESASREALLDAFRRRHCYAATDNIVLDVRAGEYLMGDEFTSKEPVRLSVKAFGTKPIERVSIIKNSGYVYDARSFPGTEVQFTWQDNDQFPSTLAYYYVRVEQEDGQLAWSSPIWVRYE